MGWWDIPSAEEPEIPKVPHQDHIDTFIDSPTVVHKEFVPEGKTVKAEFYNAYSTGSSTCILLRDFFLLHDNAPAHKAASVCQFLTKKKCYNPLPHPVLSRFISAGLFSVPQFENEVKGLHFADVAEIQEAVPDELKKVQKEEFSAGFQKENVRPRKSLYVCKWSLLWIEKSMSSSCVFEF